MISIETHQRETASHTQECLHCQTSFEACDDNQSFCCSGCQYVYELLHREGLDRFYHLKGDLTLAPLKNHYTDASEDTDWSWLDLIVEEAEENAVNCQKAMADSVFHVGGISCVACIWLIEALLPQSGTGAHVQIRMGDGEIHLSWPVHQYDVRNFAVSLFKHGYTLKPRHQQSAVTSRDALGARTAICAGFAMNAMAFTLPFYHGLQPSGSLANLLEMVAGASATGALLCGGSWFFKQAWKAIRNGLITMEVPIALGILLAYFGSVAGSLLDVEGLFYFDFVATFTFLMLLGRWIQQRVLQEHSSRLRNADPVPEYLEIEHDNGTKHRTQLQRGDVFSIQSGQILPVQSMVLDDRVELSLDWINGEPTPHLIEAGKMIPAGARIATKGKSRFRALENWDQSHLAKLLESKPYEGFDDPVRASSSHFQTILKGYLITILGIAFISFGIWIYRGNSLGDSLQVLISVLVVSCPCALGISIPLADERVAAILRKHGVYLRRHDLWNRLSKIKKIYFDKTGTLSLASPRLKKSETLRHLSQEAKEALSYLVQGSRHPYCVSLCESMASYGLLSFADHHDPHQEISEPQEIPGIGIQWTSPNGKRWFLGRNDWQENFNQAPSPRRHGSVFQCDGILLAHFEFEEQERPDAKNTIQALQHFGYQIYITSGDREDRVQSMANKLGIPIENAHAKLSPDEKHQLIIKDRHEILYLGDGANDIPSFQAALCRGTPVSEENPATKETDFYWQSSGLKGIQRLLEIGMMRRKAVRSAFAFFLIYNLLVIGFSVTGWMNPLFAAVVMPISSLVTLGILMLMIHEKKLL